MVRPTKQVLIIRTDLKMRRGKEIAQCAHASGACLFSSARRGFIPFIWNAIKFYFSEASRVWMQDFYTKVTLQASSEQELLNVQRLCDIQGLRTALIRDAGKTACGEGMKGQEIVTALCVGPNFSNEIDSITGPDGLHPLKLY